jgi:hypothetical protein
MIGPTFVTEIADDRRRALVARAAAHRLAAKASRRADPPEAGPSAPARARTRAIGAAPRPVAPATPR